MASQLRRETGHVSIGRENTPAGPCISKSKFRGSAVLVAIIVDDSS